MLDFNRILSDLKIEPEKNGAKNGTFKHAFTVDFWIYSMCRSSNVLLLDNDILLKRDIDFIDERYFVISDIEPPF